MRKIYTAFRGFFGEIHKVYYAGGEDTNMPTKNKYYYKRKILSKVWFLFLCRLYYIGVRIFGFTQFNYER